MVLKLTKLKDLLKDKRNKDVGKNILIAFAIKGLAMIVGLVTLPAFIQYFTDENVIGLWFTMVSILVWVLSFDLGVGNGLRNRLVASLSGNENAQKPSELIGTAYLTTSLISLLLIVIGIIVIGYVNWASFLNISSATLENANIAYVVRIVFIGIMVQFVLRLVNSILYALQKPFFNNLSILITNVLILIFVLIYKPLSTQDALIHLAYAYVVFINLPLFIISLYTYWKYYYVLMLNKVSVNKLALLSIFGLGGLFFWNQIMYMVLISTNEVLISSLYSPSYVLEFQVYNKLFLLIGSVIVLALTPLWSAITKADVERDYKWLIKIYKSVKYLAILITFALLCLVFLFPLITDIWIQEGYFTPEKLNILVFGIYALVFSLNSIVSTFACGLGRIKFQFAWYTLSVILKLSIVYVFAGRLGLNWILVIISNLVVLLPYVIVEYLITGRYLYKRRNEVNMNV